MTRLMSFWTRPTVAAKNAVMAPMVNTKLRANGEASNIGDNRATMNTPAATIVAAWMRALTGVGPSIASGNHTCSGNCADLPTQPVKMPRPASTSSQYGIDPYLPGSAFAAAVRALPGSAGAGASAFGSPSFG